MSPGSTERALLAGLLLTCAGLSACASLSVADERALGAQMSREIRSEFRMLRDPTILDYVGRIGESILLAAGPQPFEYHFGVIEDDDINAFAAPAGHVYVNTGTILKARNVAELAGVIAHEVGHVVERHIAENYARQRGTNLLYQLGVAGASLFGFGGLASLGGGLAAMAVLNTFGREAEAEADAFAVRVLPVAGYDPRGLVAFFGTIAEESQSRPLAFLSSHPTTGDRIAATTALIEAERLPGNLVVEDRGRLEIIQRRILLLTGQLQPGERRVPREQPTPL